MNNEPPSEFPSWPPFDGSGDDGRHQGRHDSIAGGALTLNDSFALMARLLSIGRRTMLLSVFVLLVPYQIVAGIYLNNTLDADVVTAVVAGDAQPGSLAGVLTAVGSVAILGMFLTVVVAGAIVAAAHAGDMRLSVGTAVRIGFDRSGATLGAQVMLFVILIAGFVAITVLLSPVVMLVPALGIIAVTMTVIAFIFVGMAVSYLVVPVAVLEARGPVASLKRAVTIAWQRKGRLAGIMGLVAAGLVIVAMLGSIAVGVMLLIAPALGVVIETSFMMIMTLVSSPVTALAGYVVWVDAKNREGGRAWPQAQ
ncbi:MAG: hypothetical protein WD152_02220 [Nitriliruptoraceae bacterium]